MKLRRLMRDKIKPAKSKKYLRWLLDRKKYGQEIHHILGSNLGGHKINDYLCVIIDNKTHQELHYKKPEDNFEQYLAEAINNLINYIEELENKNESTN